MVQALAGLKANLGSMYMASPIVTAAIWYDGDGKAPDWTYKGVDSIYATKRLPTSSVVPLFHKWAKTNWNAALVCHWPFMNSSWNIN